MLLFCIQILLAVHIIYDPKQCPSYRLLWHQVRTQWECKEESADTSLFLHRNQRLQESAEGCQIVRRVSFGQLIPRTWWASGAGFPISESKEQTEYSLFWCVISKRYLLCMVLWELLMLKWFVDIFRKRNSKFLLWPLQIQVTFKLGRANLPLYLCTL